MPPTSWLALMIGNSRLHWAYFAGETIDQRWDTDHLAAEQAARLVLALERGCFEPLDVWAEADLPAPMHLPHNLRLALPADCPLWVASVVPAQAALWQSYRAAHTVSLADIPLAGLYSTLGIDRALAVLGAAAVYGLPSLVIDAGTALTFTGADAAAQLVGGAILPGLRLQLRSLAETALLPDLTDSSPLLPLRWSSDTPTAIWSGVLYSLLASLRDFIADWRQRFPTSSLLLTGGDAALLHNLLAQQSSDFAAQIKVDPNLIFWGMQRVRTPGSPVVKLAAD